MSGRLDHRKDQLTERQYAAVRTVIAAALRELGITVDPASLLKPLEEVVSIPQRAVADTEAAARGSSTGQLSPRECEVLELLLDGASTEEIADILTISPHTARQHVKHLLMKFGVRHRTALVAKAMRTRLTAPADARLVTATG